MSEGFVEKMMDKVVLVVRKSIGSSDEFEKGYK